MPNPLYDALFAPLIGRQSPFLILPDGSEITGDAFHAMCAQVAGRLGALGLAPGDRMAVQVEKSADALALYGGAVMAGVVFLPLNTAYTPDEVAYFLSDAGARLLLADSAKAAALATVAAQSGARLMVLDSDGSGSFSQVAAAPAVAAAERDPGDLAALLYTSGTTGRSKGAMLSQRNLLSNAEVLTRAWRFTDQDVLLHALPIFHTHGLFVAANMSIVAGATMIWLTKFDADEAIGLMADATVLMGVPTFYTRLLKSARLNRDSTAGMRLFVSGSAPLLAEDHRAFEERTGHAILERYGMTETCMITTNPYDGARKPGAVGMALPGIEVRVTERETGAPLPDGEIGAIEVRGPNVFQGYWQMPEKTASEFRKDGFFITGDLGQIGDDGYLRIVGRDKDLVISGGYNVYPKEVESLIDDIPGVVESAVIGLAHPDLGEGVTAIVVPQKGADIDEGAVIAAITDKLARYKQPKRVLFVDELPRNVMGKVQKAELRKSYADLYR